MQDVTPPNNERSIRNIPVPPNRRHAAPLQEEAGGYEPHDPRRGEPRHRSRSSWLWIIAILVGCVLVGTLAAAAFSGATVTIFPREEQVSLPSSVIASLDAPVGSLSYRLMTVSERAERTTPATGTTEASIPAQGTITIYNGYSTAAQKLITNTRFEAPDGKIYRIRQAITVPGATKNADGSLVPGSIDVIAYADKPGAEYNRSETRFTVPGFKGDPRYGKFYATTSGMSGGFVGLRPSVSQTDLDRARSDMQQQLQEALSTAAASQVPEGFLRVPDTFRIQYGEVSTTDAGNGNATLVQSATATAAIVRSGDLASAIATLQVQDYAGDAIDFESPSSITLSVATGTPYAADSTSFALALAGNPTLVWQFDPQAVKDAVAGKERSEFDRLIRAFSPAIERASAELRPFWKGNFPTDTGKIEVKTEKSS